MHILKKLYINKKYLVLSNDSPVRKEGFNNELNAFVLKQGQIGGNTNLLSNAIKSRNWKNLFTKSILLIFWRENKWLIIHFDWELWTKIVPSLCKYFSFCFLIRQIDKKILIYHDTDTSTHCFNAYTLSCFQW